MSARIASLEQDPGVRLLGRGGRDVKLTSQGLIALVLLVERTMGLNRAGRG